MSEAIKLETWAEELDKFGFIVGVSDEELATELRRLSAELAALKAAMGEPVAYVCPTSHATADGSMEDGPEYLEWADEASDYEKRAGTPLYTHQAPQAKPQPLTSDQKWDMWTAATIEQPSARGCYFRGVEDAEHAHGITKE